MSKKIVYVDMDGVVADFHGLVKFIYDDYYHSKGELDEATVDHICSEYPEFFQYIPPIKGSIEAVNTLSEWFDIYFLSTPVWNIPNSFKDKRIWIENHFGKPYEKRLILTHRKDLNIGHYLIDDRLKNGAEHFSGEHIHFGTERFPNWITVLEYLGGRK